MPEQTIVEALLLGVLEGLTEFIPVSSTGHILLAGHFLGFKSPAKTFEILIQLGAILAVLSIYAARLWKMLLDFPHDVATRRFVFGVLLAFLPAVVVGVAAYKIIKTVLFETPMLICVMLILGGILLLWVDRWGNKPRYHDITRFPLPMYFKIGLFQCLSMIPGTSRSGATIVGGLLLGADKRAAAEFSFFLAMPTMAGAFVYDLYQNYNLLTISDLQIIAVGFIAAFLAAVLVVRSLLNYVSKRGYGLFGWWRICVGLAGLGALLAFG